MPVIPDTPEVEVGAVRFKAGWAKAWDPICKTNKKQKEKNQKNWGRGSSGRAFT
jgi:hypothetical protein